MKPWLWMPALAWISIGCGTQSVLLGTQSDTVFIAEDTLALPNEQVDLRSKVFSGDFLTGQAGLVVRYFREDGSLYRAAETADNGQAAAISADAGGLSVGRRAHSCGGHGLYHCRQRI